MLLFICAVCPRSEQYSVVVQLLIYSASVDYSVVYISKAVFTIKVILKQRTLW